MSEYRIHRSGDVDLVFDGEILADESSQGEGLSPNPMRSSDPSRWTEVRIYRLTSGDGWVTETVGKSSRRGEVDRPTVKVCKTPAEVRDSLRHPRADYLINAALDALEEAAEKDPRLATATTERL